MALKRSNFSQKLQRSRKFNVKAVEVKRPTTVDLLISIRQNHLHPVSVKTIGGITLYAGPLGKVFGGNSPSLDFDSSLVREYPSSVVSVSYSTIHRAQTMRAVIKDTTYCSTARSDRDLLEFFKSESIGVECRPRCGGCRCGKCTARAKHLTLKDERDYSRFKLLLHLDKIGTSEDPGPYWVSHLPWTINRADLPGNKTAVLGVMESTIRKLSRDDTWRQVYDRQLLDLIQKGFAREVFSGELSNWVASGGVTYYIAHQMAINPSSKSTPVRVVFNSSQKYRGHSINNSLELGPDVLNSLQFAVTTVEHCTGGACFSYGRFFL